MRIEIDQDKCIGAGQCVVAAEAIFDQRDEDGIVVLLDPTPPESLWAAAREGAELCPAAAIRIVEDDK